MTTLADYLRLVTSQHADKPKFVAFLSIFLQALVDVQNTYPLILVSYDLDTAVGSQLDVVGEWIGASRDVSEPLVGVYFSLDDASLGLDLGSMQGPTDPTAGLVQLPDEQYRQVLFARIANNTWDGSIPNAYEILDPIFQTSGATLLIQDNGDDTMIVALVGGTPPPILVAMFTSGLLNVKPAGVGITYDVWPSGPLFGLGVENSVIAGLDVGAFGSETAGA